jgi:starch synthase
MSKIKILYIAPEVSPILNDTSVGDFVQKLPIYMQNKGCDIRIFVPKFGILSERKNKIHQVTRLSGLNITVGDTVSELLVKSTSLQEQKIQVYFIDGDVHFQRKDIFLDSKGRFIETNDKRAIFFCRGVLETLYRLDWGPDIIHCHDWMTAFLPIILKYVYAKHSIFKHTKSIFTVYNNLFDHIFNKSLLDNLNLPGLEDTKLSSSSSFSILDIINMGINYSNATYTAENLDEKYFKNIVETNNLQLITNSEQGMETYYNIYKNMVEAN